MALIEVKIPPLGESISSGILAKWHVADGDTVRKDQPLFELETDKITSEGTAEVATTFATRSPRSATRSERQPRQSIRPRRRSTE